MVWIYRACNRVFSYDVTVTILVFQNNEMAAMLVFQTKHFLLFHRICIDAGHRSENALYCSFHEIIS